MTASTLVGWQDPGRTALRRAAWWHEWSPAWLPARLASMVRQLALRRYRAPVLCRLPGDQQFVADPSDLVQCLVATTGGWEQLIFEAVRPIVPAGSTVLDIGAHVGYAALRFSDWVGPSGRVVCFEPLDGHIEQLRRNLDINGYSGRTTVVQTAVCDEIGERPFVEASRSNSGMSRLGDRSNGAGRLVRTSSLDGWLAGRDMAEIALIKIDVEGAEALVLAGMRDTLARACARAVLIELHEGTEPGIGRRVAGVFGGLDGRPYRLFDWNPDGRFGPVGDEAPANYLLALRRDAVMP